MRGYFGKVREKTATTSACFDHILIAVLDALSLCLDRRNCCFLELLELLVSLCFSTMLFLFLAIPTKRKTNRLTLKEGLGLFSNCEMLYTYIMDYTSGRVLFFRFRVCMTKFLEHKLTFGQKLISQFLVS